MELSTKEFDFENIKYTFFGLSNEHIFKHIPWYEFKLLNYIKKLDLTGVYIDVGANIGNHSLFFLNHCNSTKLYSFEPDDFCYNILTKNLQVNGKKEYHTFNMAIWNEETNLNLIKYESFDNTGMSKTVEINDNDNIIKVNANSLDNLIPLEEKIVLIKIDTEGSESIILNGSLNLIKKNYPIIICEAENDIKKKSINDILLPLGYNEPLIKFNATPTYVWII